MKNLLLIALSLITFSACVELEGPLCTNSNFTDIAGLEGYYQIRIYNPENLEIESTVFSFERRSRGNYSVNGEDSIQTCRIGGNLYAQTLTSHTGLYTPYRVEGFWNESGLQGFQLMFLGASRRLLEQRGFPHRVEETDTGPDEKGKKLVLENSGVLPDSTVQVLDVMAMSFTFMPARQHSGTRQLSLAEIRQRAEKFLK